MLEVRLGEFERRLAVAEAELSMQRTTYRREITRTRTIATLAVATLVAVFLFGAARPGETRGRVAQVKAPFRVVNAQGMTLLEVDSGKDGAVLRAFNLH